MATKLGKVVICHEELPLIKLLDPSIMWFCKVTWHVKYFISPLKYGKMVTHLDGLSHINSHNPLNMYSRESRDKLKTYLHHQMLMVTRLISVVT